MLWVWVSDSLLLFTTHCRDTQRYYRYNVMGHCTYYLHGYTQNKISLKFQDYRQEFKKTASNIAAIVEREVIEAYFCSSFTSACFT